MQKILTNVVSALVVLSLLLSPLGVSAEPTPSFQEALPSTTIVGVADDQFLASFGTFLIRFLGTIHLLGNLNLGSVGATGTTSANCQYGSTYPDGCSGAPAANSNTIQYQNFFTSYAPQSGQNYGSTRPPWNVAGVDYPVGISASSTAAGLCDPLSSTNPTGSACNPTGTTPSLASLGAGCSFNSGNGTAVCQNSSANLVLNGWDFSLHNCVHFQTNPNFTGNITIENSKFAYGSNCSGDDYLLSLNGGSSLTLLNDSFNGNGVSWIEANSSANTIISWNTATGPITAEYNYFEHAPARFYASGSTGNLLFEYNYFEGLSAVSIFQATFSGTTMNVNSFLSGTLPIANGYYLFDGGAVQMANTRICNNTICTQSGTGTGGLGTYSISQSFNLGTTSLGTSPGLHGDPILDNFGGSVSPCTSNCTQGSFTFAYNTILAPNNWGGGTAGITLYEGVTGTTISTLNVNNNTVVANRTAGASGNGAVTFSTVGVQIAYVDVTTANINQNYLDPTGSFFCNSSESTISTLNFSGNVNLTDGSAVTANSSLSDTKCDNKI
jgi:hypothetical protein